ncbi:type VI secretion system tip protein VgrG [Alphaproteobacteria bacterium HT1-32]|nr:type VI secretion system tip protein VgrG [Alphaproteobacteria bacterium HT1-32]
MADSLTQDNVYLSVNSPLGKDKLILRQFHGEERISSLFEFHLECVSVDDDLSFEKIVGEHATITMVYPDGTKRFIDGIVSSFTHTGVDPDVSYYAVEMRPWFWLLTLGRDCRIFQEKSTVEIIKAIFDDAGFTDYSDSTTKTYSPRNYCVQYQESPFEFVCRLMEEDGIFYFFEHTDGVHKLVLADDADAHPDCPYVSTLTMAPTDRVDSYQSDAILSCALRQSVTTGKVALRDYNYETPSTDLLVKAEGDWKQEYYEYPGRYDAKATGEKLATLRLEELEFPAVILSGETTAPCLTSGHVFTVTGHSRKDVDNKKFMLTSVAHHARDDHYGNSFKAIPSTTPYRPLRRTGKPRIHGTQTAVVTGASGEEIYTDKFGRIKVQFHWDRDGKKDENTSCWIRVAQSWAGKSWGGWWLPRIGMEVVVSFLNGDPDRPLVTGAVYNGENTLPLGLPGEMTKSTIKSNSTKGGGGFNQIRFEDKKDSEEVYFHAQKDHNLTIENDRFMEVLHDEKTEITNDRTIEVKEGDEKHTVTKGDYTKKISAGNRTIEVTKGNETHKVAAGTRTLSVKKDEKHTNDANFTHQVKGNYTLKIDGNLTIEAGGSIKIKAGKDMTSEAGTAMTNKAGTELTDKAGTNLTSQAGANWTGKAGANVEVKAGAMLNVKASATGTVDGGGMLTVKGGMVKIN